MLIASKVFCSLFIAWPKGVMVRRLALKSQGSCILFLALQSIHSTGLSESLRIRSKGLKTIKWNQRDCSFQDLVSRVQPRAWGLLPGPSVQHQEGGDLEGEQNTREKGRCYTLSFLNRGNIWSLLKVSGLSSPNWELFLFFYYYFFFNRDHFLWYSFICITLLSTLCGRSDTSLTVD